jgi:nicotinamidase-related amidase
MHKKAFTPDNSAMVLIDHQVGTMGWTHSHDINLVKKNALRLARIAKAVGMPVVLTSSMEDHVHGPLVPELEQILPEAFAQRVRRPGIVNAMEDDEFNKAVKATGRKRLFLAGVTKYGNEIALRRIEKAGAVVTTVDQIVSELAIDWTSPNGKKLEAILDYQ